MSYDTMHIGIKGERDTRHEAFPLSEMRCKGVYRRFL